MIIKPLICIRIVERSQGFDIWSDFYVIKSLIELFFHFIPSAVNSRFDSGMRFFNMPGKLKQGFAV